MSVRAEAEDIEKLQQIAIEENIALSTLISNMIKSYVEWDYMEPKLGMMPIAKGILSELVNSIEQEKLKEIAAKAADDFMGHMIMLAGETSLDAFLRLNRNRAQRSGFTVSETVEGDQVQLAIRHGMGRNWSTFFAAYHERILYNLGYRAEVEIRDDVKVIRVNRPPTSQS